VRCLAVARSNRLTSGGVTGRWNASDKARLLPAQVCGGKKGAHRFSQQFIDRRGGSLQCAGVRHIPRYTWFVVDTHTEGCRDDLYACISELVYGAPHMGGVRHKNDTVHTVRFQHLR
jgi:hypothetical protein